MRVADVKNKIKVTIVAVLLAALVAVFGYSVVRIVAQLSEEKEAKDSFDALKETVREIEQQAYFAPAQAESDQPYFAPSDTSTSSEIAELPDAEPERLKLPQYAVLYKQNPDLFGWLRIEGTPIDYPVMYTPDDSEYYLHRDFYGTQRNSGSLFIDGACSADGNFYLIYGHSMKNKTMFGTLKQYAKTAYWEKHKTVHFDTLYEKRTYTVMAAFYSSIDDSTSGRFKYYRYRNLSDPVVFDEYVANVIAASLYDTGITAQFGDELITLSTCNTSVKDGRFVVVAKRVS